MIKPLSLKSKLSHPKNLNSKLQCSQSSSHSGQTYTMAHPDAVRALIALMDMEAVMGGAASHFGGPAALAEINSALYAIAFKEGASWTEHYNLINDAGHCENGLYALKALYGFAGLGIEDLKKFRSIESPLTGHGEVHVFPEGVQLSNGPLGSSVAQAQGLAVGDKLSEKRRTTVLTLSDGGAMEGEAREALASIPGLAAKGLLNPFVLVISDNNTKLSHRIDEDSFSMGPSFEALETLGWKLFKNIDGHSLSEVLGAFEKAFEEGQKDPRRPVALHFKTLKGKGYKKSEDSQSGGHGFPLKTPEGLRDMVLEVYGQTELPEEIEAWLTEVEEKHEALKSKSTSEVKTEVKAQKIQVGLSEAFVDLKKKDFPLISVSSDLYGSTGMAGFRKNFPDSSIDVGIAESNMVSLGAGLSKSGYIPVVDTFAQFGVTKGALPLTMASLSEAPVLCVFSHTGFQDAADGASHQALSYFAMMSSLPYVDVVSLSCSEEAYAVVTEVVENFKAQVEKGETPRSTVFFLGRENFPEHYGVKGYKLEGETFLKTEPNAQAVILTTGSLVPQALQAHKELKSKGVSVNVVSKAHLNGSFSEDFKKTLENSQGKLVVVEDHQKVSGFGSYALSKLSEQYGLDLIKEFKVLGVGGGFGRSAYKAQELYDLNGIGSQAIMDLF